MVCILWHFNKLMSRFEKYDLLKFQILCQLGGADFQRKDPLRSVTITKDRLSLYKINLKA